MLYQIMLLASLVLLSPHSYLTDYGTGLWSSGGLGLLELEHIVAVIFEANLDAPTRESEWHESSGHGQTRRAGARDG